MNTPLTPVVVTNVSEFSGLHDEWNRLLDRSRSRSICLTWEWLFTWWEVYGGAETELRILLLRSGETLVGIAPFIIMPTTEFFLTRIRTLRFLGTGEPEWEEVASEYLDIIAVDGYEIQVAQCVWSYFQSSYLQWDQIVFNDVMDDSLVITHLQKIMNESGIHSRHEHIGTRYRVDLPGSWSDYLATLDNGTKKRLLYKRRKLERAGSVEEEQIAELTEVDAAFSELVRLHALRWVSRGRTGVFISERFFTYHKKLIHRLLPRGILNLRLLRLDKVVISALYNFRCGTADYFYQTGFDVEGASKYSPGLVSHSYAIEDAIRAGMKKYDFMKGGTVSYKSEFGCQESPMYDLYAYPRSGKGYFLYFYAMVKDKIRSFKRGTNPPQVAEKNGHKKTTDSHSIDT